MMMKFRDHYCNMRLVLSSIIVCLFLASCGAAGEVKFCEKPDNEEEQTQKCGKVFTIGELRIIAAAKEPFGKKKVIFKLYDLEDRDKLPEETIEVSVAEDSKRAYTDIELYDAGKYRVSVETVDGKSFGVSEVTLIDE